MTKKSVKKAAAGKRLYLYYFDCTLQLVRESAGSKEALLLMKTHPDFSVGFYTPDADPKMIFDDAAFTKELLLEKRAA